MSRKITEIIARKFMNDESYRLSNSEVRTDFKTTRLYLHNNLIAKKEKATGKIYITLAGWNTNTTRERLNGLPNVRVTQKDFIPYLNGKEMNSYDMYEV